jgi:CHAT domain-containing protein/tetratricopeptide (TPR) repeat protein
LVAYGLLVLIFLVLSFSASASAASPPEVQERLATGRAAFSRGAFDTAIESWALAAVAAERAGDRAGQIQALVQASEAYTVLGRYRQAVAVLDRALKLAEASGDRADVPWVLARLGNVLIATGPPDAAEITLRRSLDMAREGGNTALRIAVLNDLGNFLVNRRKLPEAIAAYRESVTLAERAGDTPQMTRARVNLARALRQAGDMRSAREALDGALGPVEASNPSREGSFLLVSIGVGYRELHAAGPDPGGALLLRAARALNRAHEVAGQLGDRRTASYARGYLGTLYEDERRYPEALQLTREAIFAAQQAHAPEALYRWQWQVARLHRKMGAVDEALAAYRAAAQHVASVRPELSVRYDVSAESFRESIGPLYFELVDLLLRRAADGQASGSGASGAGLSAPERLALRTEAREVVESFKVAELRDYFRDDCVDIALSRMTQLDVVSSTAAVVYPIVLADRIELLVTLPSGLQRFVVPIGEARLTQEVRQFRHMLERRTTRQYLRHARQLHDWLIRPLEAELAAAKIDTLVFVPDGPLRTIPMAALHDGRQFLVAKYALAITPGLKLTDPRPLDRKHPRILAVGVTESVQGFAPLPEVETEIANVREVFGGTTLLNAQFSVANLEREMKKGTYSILHIASHGEFGGDVDKTFLLAFDGKLTMDRLDQLIGVLKYRDEPLELLTLSACDTAEGDDRAALGLAGVAVKAGARSAVATLWSVNDEASAGLITDFYRELKNPSVSRGVALQRAQVKLLSDPRYEHPGFWSPFLLINNWL